MKICSKCKIKKSLDNFSINNKSKDKLSSWCIQCQQIIKSYYRKTHRKILNDKNKIYYHNNKHKILKKQKLYRQKNKDKINLYYQIHKSEIKIKRKSYFHKYYIKNKKIILANNKRQRKNRLQNDINFKIRCHISSRIATILKRNKKSKQTLKLLGCDLEFLKKHLEAQFKEGMSWSNHGSGNNGKGMQEWHIDHIYPCSSFNLSKPSEQQICFHWSNMQPLWAKENWIKSDK